MKRILIISLILLSTTLWAEDPPVTPVVTPVVKAVVYPITGRDEAVVPVPVVGDVLATRTGLVLMTKTGKKLKPK